MTHAKISLFCPICGVMFIHGTLPQVTMHTKEFGHVCGRECYDRAELKYVRMVMGKDDIEVKTRL